MSAPVVSLHDVSKRFRLRGRAHRTLKSAVLDLVRGRPAVQASEGFDALHHVNIELERGRSLGIIGRNGSGKSTLLKIIAGIYRPDAGTVDVRGRVAALASTPDTP